MDGIRKTYILVNSMVGGGAERQISYISRLSCIDKVICIEPNVGYPIQKEKLVFLTSQQPKKSIVSKIGQLISAMNSLRKMKIDRNTHLICFLQLSMIIGVICKLLFGCKLTLSIRLNPFMHKNNSNERSISLSSLRYMLRKADHIVPNSLETSQDIINHFPECGNKVRTIRNGFDLDQIELNSNQTVLEYNELMSKHFCLLNTGRMDSQKGQWHIIRIFAALIQQFPDIKLIILGQGNLQNNLIQLAEDLHLKTFVSSRDDFNTSYQIYFPGFQSNPYFFYKRAKVFLFPSIYEGLPNALIESLLCGTPVISANCKSGPIEILLGENDIEKPINQPNKSDYGYLMPAFSGELILNISALNSIEEMWKSVCSNLINDTQERELMHQQCRNLQQRYTFESVQHDWKQFIELA